MSHSISKIAVVFVTMLCIVTASAFSASSSAIGNRNTAEDNHFVQITSENEDQSRSASQTISSGQYFIRNNRSGKYLTFMGVNVAQYSRSDNETMLQQRWSVVYMGNAYYYLEPMENVGYRLDVANAANYNGANVGIHPKNGNAAQKYQILSCGGDSYRLVPACSTSRVLDVEDASMSEGANVQIWEYINQSHQQWTFESASSEPYHAYEWSWVFEDGDYSKISCGYRTAGNSDHFGIDIIANYGDIEGAEIIAPTSGVVVERYSNNIHGGNMAVIETDNYTLDGSPLLVAFLHMQYDSCPLSEGDTVEAGDLIGRVGNTGDSYGNHLHLSTFRSAGSFWPSATTGINPERFFKYVSLTGDRSTMLSYPGEEEYQ